MYLIFGLSATSQEMLSTAQGAINPIKRSRCCVTSYSKTPPGSLHNDDDNVNDGDIHDIIIMLAYNLHAHIMAVLGNTYMHSYT